MEKIDVISLNQPTYAAAITAIKTARVENECIIKKRNINRRKEHWAFNMNRRINELLADIVTNERSKTFTKNEKKNELDEHKIPNCRRANKIHLTRNTQTTSICP